MCNDMSYFNPVYEYSEPFEIPGEGVFRTWFSSDFGDQDIPNHGWEKLLDDGNRKSLYQDEVVRLIIIKRKLKNE